MALQAEEQITDVYDFFHDADEYEGIDQVSIRVFKGKLKPVRKESELFASGADLVGGDEFPVRMTVRGRSSLYLMQLLTLPKGTTKFKGKVAGSTSAKWFTIVNNEFETSGGQHNRDDKGSFTVDAAAYSVDGSTIPLTITDVT